MKPSTLPQNAGEKGLRSTAWQILKMGIDEEEHERERTRLAYIVASFAMIANDENEMVEKALRRYREAK